MGELDYRPPDNLEELFQTNPWWKGVSDECDRVYRVQQLPKFITPRHKHGVIEALFEHLEISEEKLQIAKGDPVFEEARAIIQNLKAGDPFPPRLSELFQSRKGEALKQIKNCFARLLVRVSHADCRTKIEQRWDESPGQFPPYRSLVEKYSITDLSQRFIIRSIGELDELRARIHDAVYPFHEDDYFPVTVGETKEEKRERVDYLAYRVFDPLWISNIEHYEPEYVTFPLKWAGALLNVTIMKELYAHHRNGNDVLAELIPYFKEGDALSILENAVRSCPLTSRHGELFGEIVSDFRSNKFRTCSISLLTLIEGLVWDFAWWWNLDTGKLFDRATSQIDFLKGKFKLINKNGEEINTTPNIGLLLRHTRFGEEFYFEFLEFFCDELFSERNPVLHGRQPNYGNEKKVATLLFIVRCIEKEITEYFMGKFTEKVLEQVNKIENVAN